MSKKLLFFDVDGTIVTQDTYEIPASTVESIRRARENGHLAVINTGRPFGHVERKIREIGFDGYICSCGMYIEFQGTVIKDDRLPVQLCEEVRDLSRECNVEMTYESCDAMFFDAKRTVRPENRLRKQRLADAGVPVYLDVDKTGFQYDKFLAWKSPDADWARFFALVNRYFCAIEHHDIYECVPLGYTKATGMQTLASYLGFPMSETVAFGDSQNDVEMLRCAGVAVLLGNAPERLHALADYVAADIHVGGLADGLRHCGLI